VSTHRILIVDDDAAYRRLLGNLLAAESYDVAEAGDGSTALESIAQNPPDLVLLDLEMPGVDGFSVCRQIKQDPRTRLLPVIIVTTLEWRPAKLLAIQHLADDFLNKPVNPMELMARVKSLLSLKKFTDELENAGTVLKGIALAVEKRDSYTGGHVGRVGQGAGRLARCLGLKGVAADQVILGGQLHDMGKIAIPDSILRKSGPLTPEEKAVIQQHPAIGEELCRPMRTLEPILPLIRSHHEHLDGSGYPDGLSGKEIPLVVRIISVVDVYDALTTTRSYRKAHSPEEALRILREEARKGWWDSKVVESWGALNSSRAEPVLNAL
jgi:putative two-component system response regulator